ncbi:MAG: OFA family MFS transporter [Vitreoscilla sp.]
MSTVMNGSEGAPSSGGWLSKERTIAGPGYNRWLLPPAALAIHLCIGMAYGFSVFWLPLSKLLPGAPVCSKDPSAAGNAWMQFVSMLAGSDAKSLRAVIAKALFGGAGEMTLSSCNWDISALGWIYTLFFVFLGGAAALWGGWLEHVGPRKAAVVAAVCWAGGMALSTIGVSTHQLWIMVLGLGVIGGIGLGLGYISPVSTLIKWFPDKRGMATGMAIMGFGGGAMIGSPLAAKLMAAFGTDGTNGVQTTLLIMAAVYFVFMLGGAFGYRIPAAGWKPEGWTPPAPDANAMITRGHVHVKRIWGIPQFWLVWLVLTMNVSAGIGVIGLASPMLQEIFGGHLIGLDTKFSDLAKADLTRIAGVAAGFAALISLFNIGGRFFWASISDKIGRKMTYVVFFVLGALLYASLPSSASGLNKGLFVGAVCIILSMYGGGFATVPAYLSDLFGTQMVGAIHGRLLTAWSTAGILGPVVVNYMRDYQLSLGIPREQVYNQTMYILVGFLVVGLLCNLAIRPVNQKYFMSEAELAEEKRLAHERASANAVTGAGAATAPSSPLTVALAWLAVGIPLAWGVSQTLISAAKLFN